MNISSDWHIHTHNSCDSASLHVVDLVREARRLGVLDFGVADHLHTPYNFPDLVRSRAEFVASHPSPRFHFGVEVSVVSRWELEEIARGCYRGYQDPVYGLRGGGPVGGELAIGLCAEDLAMLGVEYVVGGVHWPMYVELSREAVIRDYHRQYMFLAANPLVDIIAHPWWWNGHWRDDQGDYSAEPWFDDFMHIPGEMHNEFASTVIEHGKKVEVNIGAMLLNPHYSESFVQQYLDYLVDLQSGGVLLCIASDCHSAHYDVDFETTDKMLRSADIRIDKLWCMPPRNTGDPENPYVKG